MKVIVYKEDFALADKYFSKTNNVRLTPHYYLKHVKLEVTYNIINYYCMDGCECKKCNPPLSEQCKIYSDSFINFKQYLRKQKLKNILDENY